MSILTQVPNFNTEGTKDDGDKVMLALLYPNFIMDLGRKLQEGYNKYGYKNYMKDLDKMRITSAALRHLLAIMRGEWSDENDIPHTAGVAANMMMLQEMYDSANNDATERNHN